MPEIGLYYPYISLPDDAWVKAAALHWTQLGRIRPHHYHGLRDSEVVRRLKDELDFVVDVDPRHYWRLSESPIDDVFFGLLEKYEHELVARFGAGALGFERHGGEITDWRFSSDDLLPLDSRMETIHLGKFTPPLVERLVEAGLLMSPRFDWRRKADGRIFRVDDLVMHHRLAGFYLTLLAEGVAEANAMTPVTDQPLSYAAVPDWTSETRARILLGDDDFDSEAEGRIDYGQAFAVMAFQTVLPKGLEDVPVHRVVEARRRLLPELMRYREFLDSLAGDFAEICCLPDPRVRDVKLRNHVERQIAQPIEKLEREIGRLGLQPVRAVLSLQTLAPPAALGVLSGLAHLPPVVTGAGMVAGCLVGAASSALDRRRQTAESHPAGYLLSLRKELAPSDTVARIRGAMRRATPG